MPFGQKTFFRQVFFRHTQLKNKVVGQMAGIKLRQNKHCVKQMSVGKMVFDQKASSPPGGVFRNVKNVFLFGRPVAFSSEEADRCSTLSMCEIEILAFSAPLNLTEQKKISIAISPLSCCFVKIFII
jgi:hypothetical protein